MYRSPTLPALLMVASFAVSSTAFACDEAERLRLSDEIESLVKKNAWTGVERKYEELEKAKCEMDVDTHNAGAQAARFLGKTYEMYERLQAASAQVEDEAVSQNITGIENNYGKVEIRGSARKRAALVRPAMPFPPDQVKSIQYAQKVMEGTGSFKGMLPNGGYQVADQAFDVESGADWQTVLVGKAKAAKPGDEPVERTRVSNEGLIAWMGPVVMVGGGLMGAKAPGSQVVDTDKFYTANPLVRPDGLNGHCGEDLPQGVDSERFREDIDGEGNAGCYYTVRQPGDIALGQTGVVDLTLGWEVGLTYKAPEMGVVVLANYRRTPGKQFNHLMFQVGPVIRPGIFRVTAGGTWGILFGRTQSYAGWVNEGQRDGFDVTNPLQAPEMKGAAYGFGAAGSFGAALLDLGPFEGTVEVHASWMNDNTRNHTGIGVRMGIVPKLQRFED